MAAKARDYLNSKNIKGLSAHDEELVGKCIVKFEQLDKNNDKSLSKDEVKGILTGTNLKIDAVMSTLDLDVDGRVSLDEFLGGIVLVKVENLYRPIFNSFDKDNNGQIEVDDLLQVLEGKGYSKDAIIRVIKEKDLDQDGRLSYDEFIKYFFALKEK